MKRVTLWRHSTAAVSDAKATPVALPEAMAATRAPPGAVMEAIAYELPGAAVDFDLAPHADRLRATLLRLRRSVAMPVSMQFNAGSIHASPGALPLESSTFARRTLKRAGRRGGDEGQCSDGRRRGGRPCLAGDRLWAPNAVDEGGSGCARTAAANGTQPGSCPRTA